MTAPADEAGGSGRLHHRLSFALQAFMALGLAAALYERLWLTSFLIVWILFLTLLPLVLKRRFDVFVPPEFELTAILFLFASLFLGSVRGYYTRFWWWDVMLHTSSGFLLGILGFLLVYVLNQEPNIKVHMRPAFVALFSFSFAVALGALWEVFEFGMDELFGLDMQGGGLRDTMGDLIVDTAGALVVAGLGYAYMRVETESFVEKWALRFVRANPRLFRKQGSAGR